MLPPSEPDRIRIAFDDHRLVANAGLILPVTLAQRLGLRELVGNHVDLGNAPGRANTGDKVLTLVASALALGGPVQPRPGPIAHPAAPLLIAALLTAAPATGPPRPPSSTSQSKVFPTHAARSGQRECLAAFGHLVSRSPHRQQACYWTHPPEIRPTIQSPSW